MSDAFTPGDPDRITETTSKNVFQRMGGALVGAAIGIVLIVVAVGLLAWNESRAVDAIRGLGQAARDAVDVSPSPVDGRQDGRLVHVSGPLAAHDVLSDPFSGLTRADLVHLKRKVEMFQWKETRESQSSDRVGGSQTTQTTYVYTKAWSEEPVDSAGFRGNHANPDMPLRTEVFTASDVTIGPRRLAPKLLDELAAYSELPLPASAPDGYRRDGSMLYKGNDPSAPRVGDIRVTYRGVAVQPVSILAQQNGSSLAPFHTQNGYSVGLVIPGDVDAGDMVAQKRSEEKVLTWVLRLVGWLAIFVALLLLAWPLRIVADILPFVGSLVGGGIVVFAVAVSLTLTLLVIALSWIVVRPLLGVGLLAAAALVFFGHRRLRPPSRAARP